MAAVDSCPALPDRDHDHRAETMNSVKRFKGLVWPQERGLYPLAGFAVRWVALIYVLAVLVWLFMRMVSGEALGPVRFATSFHFWIGIGLLVIAGLLLKFVRRWAVAGVLLLGLLLLAPYMRQFSPFGVVPDVPVALTVMSYNTYARNDDPAAIARVIAAAKPDIALLQEVADPDAVLAALVPQFGEEKLHVLREPSMLLMIVSRYEMSPLPSLGSTQSAIVHVPQGGVRVWNLHAPKTFGGPQKQYEFVRELVAALGKEVSGDIEPATLPRAVLAAGDFNATEQSASYRYLNRYFGNAFARAGWGLGATFPAEGRRMSFLPSMIRIDHIFYKGPLVPLTAQVVADSGGSDHYPVTAQFGWRN
tara:strand:+ start:104101 stop:105189 length:1089 start_codon:yes stop_codon:yes gene_type:complete